MDKESVYRDACCHEIVVRMALNVQLLGSNLEREEKFFWYSTQKNNNARNIYAHSGLPKLLSKPNITDVDTENRFILGTH